MLSFFLQSKNCQHFCIVALHKVKMMHFFSFNYYCDCGLILYTFSSLTKHKVHCTQQVLTECIRTKYVRHSMNTWRFFLKVFLKKFTYLLGCVRPLFYHVGSSVAACGVSCSLAHGILVPQPGIKSVMPVLQGRFLTTGLTRKVLHLEFYGNVSLPLNLASLHFLIPNLFHLLHFDQLVKKVSFQKLSQAPYSRIKTDYVFTILIRSYNKTVPGLNADQIWIS